MLASLHVPIGWKDIFKRAGTELLADNCLGLAAELAYYFFLALFPALLFLAALVSFIPVHNLMDTITGALGRVAPGEAITIVQQQILNIAHQNNGGLLTVGMIGTIWSMSSGITAIMDTLNTVYDIRESRSYWRVHLIAIGLTLALSVFVVVSFTLVLVGPTLGEKVAASLRLGPAFALTWKIVEWPVVFALISFAMAMVYFYSPDAVQEWIWITPGSIVATLLWILVSLGFRFYVAHFTSYNATYGTIGGVIILLLWFYVSGLAVLVGAEINAEIEHASPYGKDPGEKVAGEKKKIGVAAEKAYEEQKAAGLLKPAIAQRNCDVDDDLPRARPQPVPSRTRVSDWVVSGLVVSEFALLVATRLRRRIRL